VLGVTRIVNQLTVKRSNSTVRQPKAFGLAGTCQLKTFVIVIEIEIEPTVVKGTAICLLVF
jgi:hypothetical protein